MKGEILNESTKRVFSDGSIIGETDIVKKRVNYIVYLNELIRTELKTLWL
jgi:hypothetical protein